MFVAYFKIRSQNFTGVTEENHEYIVWETTPERAECQRGISTIELRYPIGKSVFRIERNWGKKKKRDGMNWKSKSKTAKCRQPSATHLHHYVSVCVHVQAHVMGLPLREVTKHRYLLRNRDVLWESPQVYGRWDLADRRCHSAFFWVHFGETWLQTCSLSGAGQ
jgi:hypothetical protein